MFRKGSMWHKADYWKLRLLFWDRVTRASSTRITMPYTQLVSYWNPIIVCSTVFFYEFIISCPLFFFFFLFLFRLSFIASKMRVIPFNALSIATSCILEKIHLVPHKAIFFTKRGVSIWIFFSTAPRAGCQSTRVGLYVWGCPGSKKLLFIDLETRTTEW